MITIPSSVPRTSISCWCLLALSVSIPQVIESTYFPTRMSIRPKPSLHVFFDSSHIRPGPATQFNIHSNTLNDASKLALALASATKEFKTSKNTMRAKMKRSAKERYATSKMRTGALKALRSLRRLSGGVRLVLGRPMMRRNMLYL